MPGLFDKPPVVSVKLTIVRASDPSTQDIRRFQALPNEPWSNVCQRILEFTGCPVLMVTYQDDDGDVIRIDSDLEMAEALQSALRAGGACPVLRLTVRVPDNTPANKRSSSSSGSSEAKPAQTAKATNEQKQPLGEPAAPCMAACAPSTKAKSEKEHAKAKAKKQEHKEKPVPVVAVPEGEGKTSSGAEAAGGECAADMPHQDLCRRYLKKAIKEMVPEIVSGVTKQLTGKVAAVPAPNSTHFNVICDKCENAIVGIRYKCVQCADYDLCEHCEAGKHKHQHQLFLKIREPVARGLLVGFPLLPAEPETHKRPESIYCQLAAEVGRANRQKKCKRATAAPEAPATSAQLKPSPLELWNSPVAAATERHSSSAAAAPPQSPRQATPVEGFKATFVRDDTYADGSLVCPGHLAKQWNVCNTSSLPWPADTTIRFVQGNLPGSTDVFSVPPAEPGATVNVRVHLNVPAAPGHYTSVWRLFAGEQAFGDRLWCDVIVPDSFFHPQQENQPEAAQELQPQLQEQTEPGNKLPQPQPQPQPEPEPEHIPAPLVAAVQDAVAEPRTVEPDAQQEDEIVDLAQLLQASSPSGRISPFDSYLLEYEANSSCDDFVMVQDDVDDDFEHQTNSEPSQTVTGAARQESEEEFCNVETMMPPPPSQQQQPQLQQQQVPQQQQQQQQQQQEMRQQPQPEPTVQVAKLMSSPVELMSSPVPQDLPAPLVPRVLPLPASPKAVPVAPRPVPASVAQPKPLPPALVSALDVAPSASVPAAPAAPAFLNVREQCLRTLFEMGFFDRNLNIRLLEAHRDNLDEVIGMLLARQCAEGEWSAHRH